MARAKRRNPGPVIVEPMAIERRSWQPDKMTPEQTAEMRAAAADIAAKWAELQEAMLKAIVIQGRCQGGWPHAGREAPARRARQEVNLFLYHLALRPDVVLPPFPDVVQV